MGSAPHPEQEEQQALRKRLHQYQTRLHLLKSLTTRINSGLPANQIIQRTMREARGGRGSRSHSRSCPFFVTRGVSMMRKVKGLLE